MTEQQVRFQYQEGIVSGGYSFSAYNNVITLPKFVEKLESEKVREAIQYEALTARSIYVDEVTRLRASGEKINSVLIKGKASKKARDKAKEKYAEIWSDIENVQRNSLSFSERAQMEKPNIIHL